MEDYIRCTALKEYGLNNTQIAKSLRISRPTVNSMLCFLDKEGITHEKAAQMGNDTLFEMHHSRDSPKEDPYYQPDYHKIHGELGKKEVTMKLLHREYKTEAYLHQCKAYGYSRFCSLYAKWTGEHRLVMRIRHKPGDAIETDWAGTKVSYIDPETGARVLMHVFIAALPHSCMFDYAIYPDETMDYWIMGHIHAFEHFGGVARLLKPDNLKTGVSKHTRTEIILNKTYEEMSDYYNTAIVPTRRRRPKDKSHAEGSVGITEDWLLGPLRHEVFHSREELEKRLEEHYQEVIHRVVPALDCGRLEYFTKEEKPFLKPLPEKRYSIAQWKQLKVGADYLVSADCNWYSVPYKLVGQRVDVRVTCDKVEVFQHGQCLASHKRIHKKERYPIILEEHMPENHRQYLHYTREDFLDYARKVGENTLSVFNELLASCKEPEQVFPFLTSLRHLGKDYGPERLEDACAVCVEQGIKADLKSIDEWVKHPKQRPSVRDLVSDSAAGQHSASGITRGMDHFDTASAADRKGM